jgi:hypothetical protein
MDGFRVPTRPAVPSNAMAPGAGTKFVKVALPEP